MDYHADLVCVSETQNKLMEKFNRLRVHHTNIKTTKGKEKLAHTMLCEATEDLIVILIDNLQDHLESLKQKMLKQSALPTPDT
jgi:hypothetical protein